MPKYLIQASYTAEGTKGLLKEGGSWREGEGRRRESGSEGSLCGDVDAARGSAEIIATDWFKYYRDRVLQ